jgi:HlyD family secretion protein
MNNNLMTNLDFSLRKHILFGGICAIALVGGMGGWSILTNLSGAVVAQGTVAVEGQTKKIQHPLGGIVTAIHVKEGQRVKEGDALVTLDETTHKSNMQVFQKQVDEARVRIARLESEERGLKQIEFPKDLATIINQPVISKMVTSEKNLFESRMNSLEGQRKQLNERVTQFTNELIGIKGMIETRQKEIDLITRELDSVENLEKQGYTTLSRLIALKRDQTRSKGDFMNLKSEAEKSASRIQEAQVTLARLDQDNKKEITTELRDIKARLNELTERFASADDMFQRTHIKSPFAGYVHQLAINAVGGVIQPGEAVMMIVPDNQPMVIEAKIAQTDIDQVRIGEKALIRFTAFNQRVTPELSGSVTHVSADLTKDRESFQQQMPFYTVRMDISPKEMGKLEGKSLHPGMGAEVFIHTEDRSAISYFMKPITDQFKRAFKER